MKFMVAMAVLGVVIAVCGLIYGVLAVGVPYQEPSAAQAAAEETYLTVFDWVMAGGGLMVVAGLVGAAIIGSSRRYWPRFSKHDAMDTRAASRAEDIP